MTETTKLLAVKLTQGLCDDGDFMTMEYFGTADSIDGKGLLYVCDGCNSLAFVKAGEMGIEGNLDCDECCTHFEVIKLTIQDMERSG